MEAAFVGLAQPTFFSRSTQFSRCSRPQVRRTPARTRMCEENLTAAEKTRRALSATKPMVKFRREITDMEDVDESFSYTKGVESGVDIWLVAGILTFLVPLIGFAWGISTGIIDVNPR